MPKFEVKENFPRFPSFQFWTQGKIENSETFEIFIFSTCYLLVLISFNFMLLLYLESERKRPKLQRGTLGRSRI